MSKSHGKQGDAPTFTRESIIKLQSWVNLDIKVRFSGGRQITGVLKGFDTANNMIVDDTIEYIRGIMSLTMKKS
jgi:U6 snRNA-associated Sm-like protein LSm7